MFHVKTQEAFQNTDLDMWEFSGIDKALQTIQGELANDIPKLTGIKERVKKEEKSQKKWKMLLHILKNKGSCIRLENLNTEKHARLEIGSQNRKDL